MHLDMCIGSSNSITWHSCTLGCSLARIRGIFAELGAHLYISSRSGSLIGRLAIHLGTSCMHRAASIESTTCSASSLNKIYLRCIVAQARSPISCVQVTLYRPSVLELCHNFVYSTKQQQSVSFPWAVLCMCC